MYYVLTKETAHPGTVLINLTGQTQEYSLGPGSNRVTLEPSRTLEPCLVELEKEESDRYSLVILGLPRYNPEDNLVYLLDQDSLLLLSGRQEGLRRDLGMVVEGQIFIFDPT